MLNERKEVAKEKMNTLVKAEPFKFKFISL